MNPTFKQLFNAHVSHYEDVAVATRDHFDLEELHESFSCSDTPMCEHFGSRDKENPCAGCPVKARYGKPHCKGTGYEKAQDAVTKAQFVRGAQDYFYQLCAVAEEVGV